MSNQLVCYSFARLLPSILLFLCSHGLGQEPDNSRTQDQNRKADKTSKRKNVKLPGLVVDFENECIDLEATVCLDKGFLELVACSRGSKEHESVVSLISRPMHIHTALLLLGARNGNPALRKQIDSEQSRWIDIPPKGDRVNVFLVFDKAKKRKTEEPISSFVEYAPLQDSRKAGNSKTTSRNGSFPKSFVFAGSQLSLTGKDAKKYLADESGNVISIATFGDEVLCLPNVQSHSNGALVWKIKPDVLPKPKTKVILRLRLAKEGTDLKQVKSTKKANETKAKDK